MPRVVRNRGREKREKYVSVRMTPTEYRDISKRAQKLDMTLTELLVRAGLGELHKRSSLEERIELLEKRLEALEVNESPD